MKEQLNACDSPWRLIKPDNYDVSLAKEDITVEIVDGEVIEIDPVPETYR